MFLWNWVSSQTAADSGKSPWRLPFSLSFSATYKEHTLSGVYDPSKFSYDKIFEDTTVIAQQVDGGNVYVYPDSSSFTPDTINYNWDTFGYGSYNLRIIFVHGLDSIVSLTYSFDTVYNGNRSGFSHGYSYSLFGLRYDSSSIICPDSTLNHATFSKSYDDGSDNPFQPGTFFQSHATSVGLLSITLGGIIRPITLSAPAAVGLSHYERRPSFQSFPNPFSKVSTIILTAAQSGSVDIKICNLLGNEVADAYSGEITAGSHSFAWKPNGIAPGIYEYVIRMNGHVETLPIILQY